MNTRESAAVREQRPRRNTFRVWFRTTARVLTREPVGDFAVVALGLFALPTAAMVSHWSGDDLWLEVLFAMLGCMLLTKACGAVLRRSNSAHQRLLETSENERLGR